ncbi:hypothetical protein [Dehalogenimonas sp. 4OHTPN]|uniref:Uncharacterized protein n=1 Tax=Dehalogenimonas sp. 4OHTPN TaxID=3166643 RepID=A0AAU8G9M7_9CHLR
MPMTRFAPAQKILFAINAAGGIAVLGSYAVGLGSGTDALWGGVPAAIRPLYAVSMLVSALGYFAFIYYLLFKVQPESASIGSGGKFQLFNWIFVGILLPSALWMPLTNLYIGSPSEASWLAIRAVLALVGLASIALSAALIQLRGNARGASYRLAVAGSLYFAFHTTVLDAVVWAALFR